MSGLGDRQKLTDAQRELRALALLVVQEYEGTGRLPMPSPTIDALIEDGLVTLSSPRGLVLSSSGREAVSGDE